MQDQTEEAFLNFRERTQKWRNLNKHEISYDFLGLSIYV